MANQPEEQALFLYHLTLTQRYQNPANWTAEDHQTISRHAQFLDELGEKGTLLFAGRTQFEPGHPKLFGIAVVKAASFEEAQSLLAPDPAVTGGIQSAEIMPFSIGIRHFGNLSE
jgi:uncharacterized protein YciI